MTKMVVVVAALVLVTACSGENRGLRDLRSQAAGPDEFSVVPLGPLQMPQDLTLPPPTPGGTNLTDPTPNADAVAVLGGNPNALVAAGIPARDQALIAAAGSNGVDPNIRATLAQEDAAFRGRATRFSLFGNRDRYFQAYARQALDAYAELERFRAAGVAVPTAPPANN